MKNKIFIQKFVPIIPANSKLFAILKNFYPLFFLFCLHKKSVKWWTLWSKTLVSHLVFVGVFSTKFQELSRWPRGREAKRFARISFYSIHQQIHLNLSTYPGWAIPTATSWFAHTSGPLHVKIQHVVCKLFWMDGILTHSPVKISLITSSQGSLRIIFSNLMMHLASFLCHLVPWAFPYVTPFVRRIICCRSQISLYGRARLSRNLIRTPRRGINLGDGPTPILGRKIQKFSREVQRPFHTEAWWVAQYAVPDYSARKACYGWEFAGCIIFWLSPFWFGIFQIIFHSIVAVRWLQVRCWYGWAFSDSSV